MLKWFLGRQGGNPPKPLSEGAKERYRHITTRGAELLGAVSDTNELSKVERQIREEFSLHYRCAPAGTDRRERVHEDCRALQEIEGLAQVFLYHGDGYIRQEALACLEGPLSAPVSVFTLFWRLNDWAAAVRKAAFVAVERVLPVTSAQVILPALKAVLPRLHSWQRWPSQTRELVEATLQRRDVADLHFEEVVTTHQAGLGLIFRVLCQSPQRRPQ